MTEQEVRTILDRVSAEDPGKWPAAVQTILVAQAKVCEALTAQNKYLKERADEFAKFAKGFYAELRRMRGSAPSAAGAPAGEEEPAAEATAAQPPPQAPPVGRDPNDGREPLTPEQARIEAEMDAAIAAEEAEKPSQPQVRKRSRPAGPQPVVPPSPPPPGAPAATKNGGGPSIDQATIEAQMDAAIAAGEAEKRTTRPQG